MKLVVLCLALGCGALAQRIPTPGFVPGPSNELRTYLDLTNDQVNRMNAINAGFQRFQLEKSQRVFQVQADLQQEIAKSPLDPMGVGLRYVELEVIRREIEAMRRTTFNDVQNVLTAAQKTKLQALADIIRMYPVACEAVSSNLLGAPAQVAVPAGSPMPGNIVPSYASFLLGVPACGGLTFTRTGDFMPVPTGAPDPRP